MNPCSWRLAVLLICFHVSKPATAGPPDPLEPDAAVAAFQIEEGLSIELVTAEPDVIDPVAAAFAPDGKLWVVEMRDYPNGPADGQPPQSQIRVLSDADGDGRFSDAVVFADQLLFANGLMFHEGGVLVTTNGALVYLKDTDGDGRADMREDWFTGFAKENPQLRCNHPTLGLDGKIYVANGLRGGAVIAVKKEWAEGAQPVPLNGMDFRFDPRTGAAEAVSGFGQFGLTFDDYGNRFVCSNRNPCRHVVFEDHYLKHNPKIAVASVMHDVSPFDQGSKVYPISRFWTTATTHAGQFTAACGLLLYRGNGLGDGYYGNSFTCEPTGNLIHRDVHTPTGPTFSAPLNETGREFLATKDEWFRPVNLFHGPDGSLYVCDMYRCVIEHPEYMPDELKKRPDLTLGNDRGRIWRIRSKNHTYRGTLKIPSSTRSDNLIKLLEHTNAWYRELAFRLLSERNDVTTHATLHVLPQQCRRSPALVSALWLLEAAGAITRDDVVEALRSSLPRVAEHAVLLAERHYLDDAEIREIIESLAVHPDERVRFQVALTLGLMPAGPMRPAVLAKSLGKSGDPWQTLAVAISAGDELSQVGQFALQNAAIGEPPTAAAKTQIQELFRLIASRSTPAEAQASAQLVASVGVKHADIALSALTGLGQGLRQRGQSLNAAIEGLIEVERATLHAVLSDGYRQGQKSAETLDYIGLLEYIPADTALPELKRLVDEDGPATTFAIEVLSRRNPPEVADWLLPTFAARSPAVRGAIISALLDTADRTGRLLAEFETGRINIRELDQVRLSRLLNVGDPALRERANKLAAASAPADRQSVLAEYQPALSLQADPLAGKILFAKNCSTCHRIGDTGVIVAPDIADSRVKTPAQLLTDILDPNRAIDNNFFSYSIRTVDGQVLTGIISSETASSVTLKQPEGKIAQVLRTDIEECKSNGVSLMPVGLEKNLTVQQMADLVSFIKNWRYLDSQVPTLP